MTSPNYFVLRTKRSCLDSKNRLERGYADIISALSNISATN